MKRSVLAAIAAVLVTGGAVQTTASADVVTLDMSQARKSGNSTVITDGLRSNVSLTDSTIADGYGNVWGKASGVMGGFGLRPAGFQGVGDWANGNGARLSDVTGVSLDWKRLDGDSLGGGYRLAMYVYSSGPDDTSGYLQFDLSYLLQHGAAQTWNSTGNWLANDSGIDSAWYSADYGDSQYSGYKSWSDILTALPGWNVYEIGIINDAGLKVEVDNFTVSSVPEPATMSLLALGGVAALRRKRK